MPGMPGKNRCCPTGKGGRSVNRALCAERLKTGEGRRMMRARLVSCEGAFARMVGLLHWKRCRMWDRAGAQAERLWHQFTHNLMLLAGIWKPLALAERAQ